MRLLVVISLAATLCGCAISPPGGFTAGLDQKEEPPRSTDSEQPSMVGRTWNKMKAAIGIDDEPAAPAPLANATPGRVDSASVERALNSYRAEKGLKPVRLNTQLGTAALAHSTDLAAHDRISHQGSDGSDAWERVRRTGYGARLAAENVGTGQMSLAEVMDGWKKSKTHNDNLLLSDAREMGIAMVHKPETQFRTFWTLVLAAK